MATKTALIAEINSQYPDNTIGQITPAVLRGTATDGVNSWQQAPAVNVQTGTSYTITVNDYGQAVILTNAAAIAVTIPAGGTLFPFNVLVKAGGSGLVTITPVSGTIDGSASLALSSGQSAWLVSDGTNWRSGILPTVHFQGGKCLSCTEPCSRMEAGRGSGHRP